MRNLKSHNLPIVVLAMMLIALVAVLPACNRNGSSVHAEEHANAVDSLNEAQQATPALTRLSEQILTQPSNAGLYYERALAFYNYGNIGLALADYRKALELVPDNEDYVLALGNLLLEIGESRASLTILDQFLVLQPDNMAVLYAVAETNLILKQYTASLAAADQMLKLEVQNAPAYLLKGLNYKAVGDTARAISSFQTAIDTDPGDEEPYMQLANLLAAAGDSVALRYYDAVLRMNDTSYLAIYGKAKFYQDEGNFMPALDLYRELVVMDPQKADAIYNMATVYWAMDSTDRAYHFFDLTTRVDPARAAAYFGKGLCAEAFGRPDEAALYYTQCLNLNSKFIEAQERLEQLKGEAS